MKTLYTILLTLFMTSCSLIPPNNQDVGKKMDIINEYSGEKAEAIFAGGCFWCTESDFEKLDGVISVLSGYTGGDVKNPSYKEVSSGTTGHIEAILVVYDPSIVSYKRLVDHLWTVIDPTDSEGSFADRGFQYTSGIWYQTEEEKRAAELSKAEISKSGRFNKTVVTPILPAEAFYPAEEYHQDYYKKNPIRYNYYRNGSGRDAFLKSIWGEGTEGAEGAEGYIKPSAEELRKILTPLQYQVTQLEATEKPFNNEYWDNKEAGIYVDILSKEPLYSSTHKYASGTGWPTFDRPLEPENIVEKEDKKLFITRTEVRSKLGNNHIGHVFTDGPEETTGLRYCMNSAALEFIPVSELKNRGLGEYLKIFE